MASSVWKGHLSFGLVSVPVKLVRAARAEKVSFRQLHKGTGVRVQQKLVVDAPPPQEEVEEIAVDTETEDVEPVIAPSARKLAAEPPAVKAPPVSIPSAAPSLLGGWQPREISRSEIIKGFEYEKDRYATLSDEELKALQPKTSRTMEILEFVKLADVDPIYFETSYYVIPESAGERPYALLFESLRQSGLVAVAQMAMHNREHVVIIRAGRQGIILHTMFYENEIRKLDEFRTDTSPVNPKELDLALMLVRALETSFAPEKYRDTYREKLQELIQAKISGNQVIERSAPSGMAPVVDIMEALKKSLEQTARKPPKVEEEPAKPARAERPRRRNKPA